ncbi:MAG: CxxxxCH/CxxCH domain-containing protein [Nitrospirae bacterium]|nr:CxxxxCH/CxxCH domain-containing protein [Nitrospirota bacterium]
MKRKIITDHEGNSNKMKTKRFNTIESALIIACSMLIAVFMTGAAMAAAPNVPSGFDQYKSDGITAIAQGGTTDETSVRIISTVSDPDLDNVQIEVEIIDNAGAFTNTPNCMSSFELSGDVAIASCTGLSVGTAYKWQIRTNDGTGVSAWLQYGGTNPDVTVTSDKLMHNSLTTGNATYGAWGVTGGKYGKFVCATCHTSSGTTNIKMIKQTISAPNGTDTWPNGSTTTGSIIFTQADGINSDMGDASATGGWTGICNVCHDNANHSHYSYNSSDSHNAGMDCSECHRHSKAFSANCTNCHGQPPVDLATLVDTPGTTGSTTAGAHDRHVNTKSYACDTCHYSNIPSGAHNNGGSRDISIGFYLFGGGVQGGDYDGQAGVVYDALTTSPVTTVSATGTKTCSTVYCHSTGQSTTDGSIATPTYASPIWDGTAACGTCHKVTEASGLTSGSHGEHLGTAGVSGCADCHTGAANDASSYNSANHVNASIDVANTYSAGGAPGNGYGNCTTAVCHDNGTGTSVPSPTWGTFVPQCGACHAVAPATGSHTVHLADTVNGSSIACANCHNDAVQGTTPPTGDHLDGNIDVKDTVNGDLGYPADKAKGSAYTTCSTAGLCHVSAYGTSNVVTPVWGSPATAKCGTCHVIDATGAPATGSHNKHLSTVANCVDCHTGTVKDVSGGTQHLDGNIDVTNGYPPNVPKHAAGSGYSTCSTTVCHSNVQAPGGASGATIFATPTWGGSVNCGSCHTNMSTTTDLTLGTHMRHTNTPGVAQYSCSMCHGTGYSPTTVTYPPHVNGNIDLNFTGQAAGTTYSQAGSNPPGNGYGNCSTSNCHGRGIRNWGTYTTLPTCEKCHGSAETAQAGQGFKDTSGSTGSAYVGTHVSHLAGSHNYSSPITCNQCHIVPVNVSDAGHNDTPPPAEITFGSLATSQRWLGITPGPPMTPYYTGATRQCSSTYCHSGVRNEDDTASGSGPAPVWGDPAYLGGSGCGKCHGNPPTYPHENYSSNCSACHTHVAGDNISFIDKTKHLNSAIDWSVDACLDCHSFESSKPLIGAHIMHTDPDYMLSTLESLGTATGGTVATLTDTTKDWSPVNSLAGKYLRITSGSNNYAQHKILSNTIDTITVAAYDFGIANGVTYEIRTAKLLSAGDYGDPSWIYNISYKNGFPKYACATCHLMDNPALRNDGIVQLDLDPAHSQAGTVKNKNSATGPYSGEWVQRTTGVSVTCNGIYCHSNGFVSEATSAYTYKPTPDWYSVSYGRATEATSVTIKDSTQAWPVNKWAGYSVRMMSGLNRDQLRVVTSNTANTLTLETSFASAVSVGDEFILDAWENVDRCAQCHGNSPNTGGTEGSTAHVKHVVGIHYKDLFSGTSGLMSQSGASGAAHGNANSSTTINCNICHNGTVKVSYNDSNNICSTCHGSTAPLKGKMITDLANTTHINGTPNVAFASPINLNSRAQLRNYITTVTELDNNWTRTNGYKASDSHDASKTTPTYSGGACLSTACHNGTPMQWGQAGPLSCNVCHKGLAQ